MRIYDVHERVFASAHARLLRWVERPRARAVAVPHTGLHTGALSRVDYCDAFAIDRHPGTPADPHAWAQAILHDPPRWVVALMGLREALVGLVGIERGSPDAFAVVAQSTDEVLVGSDAGHLDFRAAVRVDPARVVLTTVVELHNRRGRGYFALIRHIHPVVVRAMLNRAASRSVREVRCEITVADRLGGRSG